MHIYQQKTQQGCWQWLFCRHPSLDLIFKQELRQGNNPRARILPKSFCCDVAGCTSQKWAVNKTLVIRCIGDCSTQCYCWWFRNPKQPPGMYKTLQITHDGSMGPVYFPTFTIEINHSCRYTYQLPGSYGTHEMPKQNPTSDYQLPTVGTHNSDFRT